jgi:hypothetical protein
VDVSQPPPQLDYAQQSPWHRRRGAQRALILVAALLLGLSVWRFGPDAIHRTQLFLLQRQAMTYSAPDGTIAFTANTEDANKIAALGGYANSGLIVTPWRDFYAKYSPPGGNPTVAFCHELVSPAGHHRLVVVDIDDKTSFEVSTISLIPAVFIPGSLLSTPKQVLMSGFGTTVHGYATTIYVGQVDPADASHFTIDVSLSGSRDTIDGYLLDNDAVTLEPRNQDTNLFPKPTTTPLPAPASPVTTKPVAKHRKKRQH